MAEKTGPNGGKPATEAAAKGIVRVSHRSPSGGAGPLERVRAQPASPWNTKDREFAPARARGVPLIERLNPWIDEKDGPHA